MSSSRPAVVLLSGGLDSATTLAIARTQGFAVHALSIRYGQRHAVELEAAGRIAQQMGVQQHVVVNVDLRLFGGSALTSNIPVPKKDTVEQIGLDIPATYVPARNTVFLSLALGFAEVCEAQDIFIGVNALDYSGYPDCRPEFIHAFETLANLATKAATQDQRPLRVHAPLIQLTKAQIIQWGTTLAVDYGLTISCYDPNSTGVACGHCDACLLRLRGFAEARIPDPARYSE